MPAIHFPTSATTPPTCRAAPPTLPGCFQDGGVLGKIPASRLYGLGLNILKLYPLPNTTGVGFNYITEQPSSQPQIQDLIRIDYNISSQWRVYGRIVKVKNDQVLPYGSFVLGINLPDYNVLLPNPRNSYAVTVTGSLSPTTIVEAHHRRQPQLHRHQSGEQEVQPDGAGPHRSAGGLSERGADRFAAAIRLRRPHRERSEYRLEQLAVLQLQHHARLVGHDLQGGRPALGQGRHLLAEQFQAAELFRQQQRPVQLHRQRFEPAGHRFRVRQRGARDLQPVHPGVGLLHRQVPLQQRRVLRARTTGRSTAG